jgi:Uma2 family endonuclease
LKSIFMPLPIWPAKFSPQHQTSSAEAEKNARPYVTLIWPERSVAVPAIWLPDGLVDCGMHQGEYLTLDEYEHLVEDDGYRSELSRGRVVREPRPGALHSHLSFQLAIILHDYVKKNDLGAVQIAVGFRLAENPPTVRGSDVSFISKTRLPAEIPVSWWPFAPDLAVEIASPARSVSELQEKIFEYFEAGTRQIWVVDVRTRSVMVYRSLSDIRIVRAPGVLEAVEILPGLRLDLDAFLPY